MARTFAPVSERTERRAPRLAALGRVVRRLAHAGAAAAGLAGAAAVVATAALLASALATPAPVVSVPATLVPPVVTVAPSAAPSVAPTAQATAQPTAPPTPRLAAERYGANGRAYTGLTVPAGTTVTSPLAGRVEVKLYQLVDGEIRLGAAFASLPSYPYVYVRAADGRLLTLRPGAAGADSEVLAKDGDAVSVGTPLVRVVGAGASSWRAFYDRAITYQIVVSLVGPSGADLDAAALFGF